MKEYIGDMWDFHSDAIVITTNGTIRKGENIMGGGCAREAADRFPELPLMVARSLQVSGNQVFHFWLKGTHLVTMPVKYNVKHKARMDLIKRSAQQLVDHTNGWKWQTVNMPRPGSGLGGLRWDDVKPEIEDILDDRFNVYNFGIVTE